MRSKRQGDVRRLRQQVTLGWALTVWILLAGAVPTAHALTWTTTPITANTYDDALPQVHSGHVVWLGGWRFVSYELATGVSGDVSGNITVETDFELHGDKVVWVQDKEIHLRELPGGADVQITSNDDIDWSPTVGNEAVAWLSYPDNRDSEVFLYDILTDTTRTVTSNLDYEKDPMVRDGLIVWTGHDGNDDEIYLHDIDADTTTQLTSNHYDDFSAQITTAAVFWRARPYGTGPVEIFRYDLATAAVTQLTSDGLYKSDLRAWGEYAVWSAYTADSEEIFLYDGVASRAITANTHVDTSPRLSGELVVWSGSDGNDFEVYCYRLATETVYALTDNALDDTSPSIDGLNVVWQQYDGNDEEILWAVLSIPADPPSLLSAVSRKDHGGQTFDADLSLDPASASVEGRVSSSLELVLAFDEPIAGAGGLDAADVALLADPVGMGQVDAVAIDGSTLTVQIGSITGPARITVSFPGIVNSSTATVTDTLCLRVLPGDVSGDGQVGVFDLLAVRNDLEEEVDAARFRSDLDANGEIDIFDLLTVRNRMGASVAQACPQ